MKRRRLPHIHSLEQPLFITFRLHDSLPPGRRFPNESLSSGRAFVAMDRILDEARVGPTYMRDASIARIVADRIQSGNPADYTLHSWVVMPNHVHLLLTPHIAPAQVLHGIKGATARYCNRYLGRSGPFWQHESYDHLVRSGAEGDRIRRYIEDNPVRAGLATAPELYPWCSAARSARSTATTAGD